MKHLRSKKIRESIGEKIREFRKSQNLTQAQLAFETGISREYLNKIERGKAPNLTLKVLMEIADNMQVHLKSVFDFKYNTTKN